LWKQQPRTAKARVHSDEAIKIAPLEDAGRGIAFDDVDSLEVAEGEGAAFLPDRIEQGTAVNPRFFGLQLAKRIGSNRRPVSADSESAAYGPRFRRSPPEHPRSLPSPAA
jgi:hypothetical protein